MNKLTKKSNYKFKLYVAAFTLSLSVPTAVYAATLDNVVAAINSLGQQINNIVIITAGKVADLIYELNPNAPVTFAADVNVPKTTMATKTTSDQLLQYKVAEQIASLNPSDAEVQNIKRTLALKKLASLQAPAQKQLINPVNLAGGQVPAVQNETAGSVFSINSLIAPNSYTDAQDKTAAEFINFISDSTEPLTKLTPKQLANISNKDSNQTYLEYVVALRSLVAARSVALNNFYHLYSERKVVKDLGSQIGLSDGKGGVKKDASPLEVRDYLAARRITNPEWHRAMASASTHSLLNELVAIEAENRYEMYEMHKDMSRLVTLLSILELKALKLEKLNIMQLEGQLTQGEMAEKATQVPEQKKTILEQARELEEQYKQQNK